MSEKVKCYFCKGEIYKQNAYEFYAYDDDVQYCCEKCKENIHMCEYCELWFVNDRLYYLDRYGFYVCEECSDEHFFACDNCGDLIDSDDLHEHRDGYYCPECYEEIVETENLRENSKNIKSPQEIAQDKNNSFEWFGIEIECYPDNYNAEDEELDYFTITTDGSLSENGVEFVSVPLPNNELGFEIIRKFSEYLKKNNTEVDTSCGYHLHIFVHDNYINIKFLKKLLVSSLKLQELFFAMQPPSRWNNNYCAKLDFKMEDIIQMKTLNDFGKWFYAHYKGYGSKKKLKVLASVNGKYYSKRYYWLNLHSLFFRNTLEIRMHSGTIDAKKIINWYLLFRNFLYFVKKNSLKKIISMSDYDFFKQLPKELKEYVRERIGKFKPIYLGVINV